MKTKKSSLPIRHIILASLVYLATAWPAMATQSALANILCSVVDILQGPLGIGAATLAVASVGTAAVLGRASWGMAVTVAIGIAVLFGAVSVTDVITGITSPCDD